MNIIIYNQSGEILRSGSCPDSMVELQIQPGEYYIEGTLSAYTYYVDVDNKVLVPFPTKPSEYHIFDHTTKQWVDPRTSETQWSVVREERNKLLAASDWTQLPDVPLATKEAWAVYRQALRDITNQPDPFNITWPIPPTT